jgi:hypothetical protein
VEANIVPPDNSNLDLILIAATDVTFQGFKISLPTVGSPSYGITAGFTLDFFPADVSGLTIEDNILEGGFDVAFGSLRDETTCNSAEASSEVTFKRNLVQNTFGDAFYLQCTSGSVQDNLVLNGRAGIQIQPYGGGTSGTVQNNALTVFSRGIYLNVIKTAPASWASTGNEITKVPPFQTGIEEVSQWTGIYFETTGGNFPEGFSGPPFLTVTGNSVNMGNVVEADIPVYGIYFRNYQLMIEDSATISGNNLTGSGEITAYISALNNQNENGDIIDLEIAEKLENENQFSEDTAVSDDPCCEIVQIVPV